MPLYDIDVIITMDGEDPLDAWRKVVAFLKTLVDDNNVFVGEPQEITPTACEECGKEFSSELLAKWHSIQDKLDIYK